MDTYTLLKYFKRELSPEEELAVAEYIANDPDGSHLSKYKDARVLFEGVVIHTWDDRLVSGRYMFKRVKGYAVAAAAAVVLFIMGSIQLTRREIYNEFSSVNNVISVPTGHSVNMTLSDGTKIWLGADSKVEIPQVFDRNERYMKINEGEVYLEVAKDEDRPFVVDTYAGKISVLGTRFDVVVDPERDYFYTALLEGSIEVNGKSDSSIKYVLKPHEILRMDDGIWSMDRLKAPEDVVRWTEGVINIVDISFDELMCKFERVFNVEVVMECKDVPHLNYTRGSIRISDGVEHAMEMLQLASDFTYEIDKVNNRIYIR